MYDVKKKGGIVDVGVIGSSTLCCGEAVIESRGFLSRKSLSRFIRYEIQYIERGTLAYNLCERNVLVRTLRFEKISD